MSGAPPFGTVSYLPREHGPLWLSKLYGNTTEDGVYYQRSRWWRWYAQGRGRVARWRRGRLP